MSEVSAFHTFLLTLSLINFHLQTSTFHCWNPRCLKVMSTTFCLHLFFSLFLSVRSRLFLLSYDRHLSQILSPFSWKMISLLRRLIRCTFLFDFTLPFNFTYSALFLSQFLILHRALMLLFNFLCSKAFELK